MVFNRTFNAIYSICAILVFISVGHTAYAVTSVMTGWDWMRINAILPPTPQKVLGKCF
jgi:hypothetical protein